MVASVWRGRKAKENAEAYGAFLERTAYPDYGEVEGNRGWFLLRREDAGAVEFVLVSFWDSMEAIRRYAGSEAEKPNYYPEDRTYLLELPERAEHYELVDQHLSW